MMIWSAFVLGLAGSLHCIGMCGPIALSVGAGQGGSLSLSRINYQVGRVFTYAVLGVVAGLLSELVVISGYQQLVTISIGVMLVLSVFVQTRFTSILPFINLLKKPFSKLITNQSPVKSFFLGILNGLLPCGLVYMAMAAAMITGNLGASIVYMIVFGLGTVPVMFALTISSGVISQRLSFNRAVPYLVVGIGILFILRGMDLGIPLISPSVSMQH